MGVEIFFFRKYSLYVALSYMLELASRVWQLAFPNNLAIFNFAKLFCVLIIPEVKKNDSNNTQDDEFKKLIFIFRVTFSEGDGCY